MEPPAKTPQFSAEEYLAWEPAQLDRHEFVDGEVFAMAGAEDRHVTVAGNMSAAFDRGLKFSHYRSLASLEEYALIDLDTRTTDCYRKGQDGLWVLHPFARGDELALASVGLVLSAVQLFAEVPEQ